MRSDDRDDDDAKGLRSYEIDENFVRVNNPDPDEPDKIIRKLASGKVETYDAKKRK